MRRALPVFVVVLAACGGRAAATGPTIALRSACAADQRWDGARCVDGIDAPVIDDAQLQADPVGGLATVEAAAKAGHFDRETYAWLWARRGIAHSLIAKAASDEATDDPSVAPEKKEEEAAHTQAALDAFDMLLALDPLHRLEYTGPPVTTFIFSKAIVGAADRPAPEIDVDWERGLRVGDAIPVEVEVIADPRRFLARAELFVRRRGEDGWRAADVDLPGAGAYRKVVLPAELTAGVRKATAVELYLRAYDQDGNEVLAWAGPERPRELPLRWDPPTPWYRKWWVWAIAGTTVAAVTGGVVYAVQWEPSDRVGGWVQGLIR